MSALDIIILALVVIGAAAAVVSIIRGKSGGCNGDCESCRKNCK